MTKKEQATQTLNDMKALLQESSAQFLKLGKLFLFDRKEQLHKALGYGTQEEMADKELGITGRTARYWATVYERYVEELDIPEAILIEIGWTKLERLLHVVTSRNWEAWFQKARMCTVYALEYHVSELLGEDGKEQKGIREKFQTFISPGQRDVVNQAIEMAKAACGNDDAGTALEMMAAEFLSQHDTNQERQLVSYRIARDQLTELREALSLAKHFYRTGDESTALIQICRAFLASHTPANQETPSVYVLE